MKDLLHRIDDEYKKPKLGPGNPDIDAVHPENNAMVAYGLIKREQKRKVKTNSGRQRLNLHGALNAETLEVTVIESEIVNTG